MSFRVEQAHAQPFDVIVGVGGLELNDIRASVPYFAYVQPSVVFAPLLGSAQWMNEPLEMHRPSAELPIKVVLAIEVVRIGRDIDGGLGGLRRLGRSDR